MIIISMPAAWTFTSRNLRKFLKDDPKVQIINVHGKGFKLIEN